MINSATTTTSSDFLTTTVSDLKISSPFTTFTTLNSYNYNHSKQTTTPTTTTPTDEEDFYEQLNNKTEQTSSTNNNNNKSKFFNIKSQRKSDYNLNILDSELVTFRKNFYHHIPKRRPPPTIINQQKTMESGHHQQQQNQTMAQQQQQQQVAAATFTQNNSFPSTSQSTLSIGSRGMPPINTIGGGSASSTLNYLPSQKMTQSATTTAPYQSQQQQQQQLQSKRFYQNEKEAADRYVWEMWMRTPNTTPASTVLNSPDLTDVDQPPPPPPQTLMTKSYPSAHQQQQYHHHHHHHHQQQTQQHQHYPIKVGRSPVGGENEQIDDSPTAPPTQRNVAMRPGDIVFDDIEETWRRSVTNVSPDNDDVDDDDDDDEDVDDEDGGDRLHHRRRRRRYENDGGCYEMTHDFDGLEYGTAEDGRGSSASQITKLIGALPINDYEGSPRRIGNATHQHDDDEGGRSEMVDGEPAICRSPSQTNSLVQTVRPAPPKLTSVNQQRSTSFGGSPFPRPGFPKRVIVDLPSEPSPYQFMGGAGCGVGGGHQQTQNVATGGAGATTKESTFDYLYEFSETRKVLEEFFKCPNDDDKIKMMSDSEGGESYLVSVFLVFIL